MSLLRPGAGLPAIAVVVAMSSVVCLFAPPAYSAAEARIASQLRAEVRGLTAPRLARADDGRKRDKARDKRRDEPRAGGRSGERDDQRGREREDERRDERAKADNDARKPSRAQGRSNGGGKGGSDDDRRQREERPRDSGREQPRDGGSEVRISPDRAASIARNAVGGRVLRVELSGGRYRVKLLVEGERVRTVQVDAPTGQLR